MICIKAINWPRAGGAGRLSPPSPPAALPAAISPPEELLETCPVLALECGVEPGAGGTVLERGSHQPCARCAGEGKGGDTALAGAILE